MQSEICSPLKRESVSGQPGKWGWLELKTMGEEADMWKENSSMDGGLKSVFQKREWRKNRGEACVLCKNGIH